MKVKGRLALSLARPALLLAFLCTLLAVGATTLLGTSSLARAQVDENATSDGLPVAPAEAPPAMTGDNYPDMAPPQGEPDGNETIPAGGPTEFIKPIEAEEFLVVLRKWSSSQKVWLLEDVTDNRPKTGKILLIKDGSTDIAAVRVLKLYPGKFAAKVVLPFNSAELGREYRSLKKIRDKLILQQVEQAVAQERLQSELDDRKTDEELASEVSPDDAELDRGIPLPGETQQPVPPPPPAEGDAATAEPLDQKTQEQQPKPLFNKDGSERDLTPEMIEVLDEDEPFPELTVNENLSLEPLNHIVSLQYSMLNSVDKLNLPVTYNAYGLRYGYNFLRMPTMKKRTAQDMLTLELGVFKYSVANFVNAGDTVDVMPLMATLRYNILLGETLMIYGYAGGAYNTVSASPGVPTETALYLAGLKPALGAGVLVTIGPGWALRGDYGMDLFAIGAALKF